MERFESTGIRITESTSLLSNGQFTERESARDICTIQIKTKWVSKLIRAAVDWWACWASPRFPFLFILSKWKTKIWTQNKLNAERWQRRLTFANTNLCSCYTKITCLAFHFVAVTVDGASLFLKKTKKKNEKSFTFHLSLRINQFCYVLFQPISIILFRASHHFGSRCPRQLH